MKLLHHKRLPSATKTYKRQPKTQGLLFQVQKITDFRIDQHGNQQYLVQWIGYPGEDTWEGLENLSTVIDLVEEFHERKKHQNIEHSQQTITTSSAKKQTKKAAHLQKQKTLCSNQPDRMIQDLKQSNCKLLKIREELTLTKQQKSLSKVQVQIIEENSYIVLKVKNSRIKRGVKQYLIQWEGYHGQDTWEGLENLQDVHHLIEDYELKYNEVHKVIHQSAEPKEKQNKIKENIGGKKIKQNLIESEIECIKAKRIYKGAQVQYLIKLKDLGELWVKSNKLSQCRAFVDAFEKEVLAQKQTKINSQVDQLLELYSMNQIIDSIEEQFLIQPAIFNEHSFGSQTTESCEDNFKNSQEGLSQHANYSQLPNLNQINFDQLMCLQENFSDSEFQCEEQDQHQGIIKLTEKDKLQTLEKHHCDETFNNSTELADQNHTNIKNCFQKQIEAEEVDQFLNIPRKNRSKELLFIKKDDQVLLPLTNILKRRVGENNFAKKSHRSKSFPFKRSILEKCIKKKEEELSKLFMVSQKKKLKENKMKQKNRNKK